MVVTRERSQLDGGGCALRLGSRGIVIQGPKHVFCQRTTFVEIELTRQYDSAAKKVRSIESFVSAIY